MKLNDFQAPVLFSSTFKALNLGMKNSSTARTFKDAWEPWPVVMFFGCRANSHGRQDTYDTAAD